VVQIRTAKLQARHPQHSRRPGVGMMAGLAAPAVQDMSRGHLSFSFSSGFKHEISSLLKSVGVLLHSILPVWFMRKGCDGTIKTNETH